MIAMLLLLQDAAEPAGAILGITAVDLMTYEGIAGTTWLLVELLKGGTKLKIKGWEWLVALVVGQGLGWGAKYLLGFYEAVEPLAHASLLVGAVLQAFLFHDHIGNKLRGKPKSDSGGGGSG